MPEYIDMHKVVEEFNKTDFAKDLHVYRDGYKAGYKAGERAAAEEAITLIREAINAWDDIAYNIGRRFLGSTDNAVSGADNDK